MPLPPPPPHLPVGAEGLPPDQMRAWLIAGACSLLALLLVVVPIIGGLVYWRSRASAKQEGPTTPLQAEVAGAPRYNPEHWPFVPELLPDLSRPRTAHMLVQFNGLGDAKITLRMRFPIKEYTALKSASSRNGVLLLRSLGLNRSWHQIEDARPTFEDETSVLTIGFVVRGLARTAEGDFWEAPVLEETAMAVNVKGNVAYFQQSLGTSLGVVTGQVWVAVPATASDLKTLEKPARVRFRLAPVSEPEGPFTEDFALHVRPQLMGCLAKSYGSPRLSALWAARGVFKNTGRRMLSDYQVRYRLVGFCQEWSNWQRCARVVPGQVVVDAYFPSLDLARIREIHGAREVRLEAQYTYRDPSGKVVEKAAGKPITLLGPNTVAYSGLTPDERIGFHDRFNNVPLILASFVTGDDPVVKRVAGAVTEMAGAGSFSGNDEDAIRFLMYLYVFMKANVTYTTPGGLAVQDQLTQHVKYGREVLRDRSGTCIDLAILYASVCQSVGLEPVLYVTPGHCFPAIQLPDGRVMAVETTMVGSADKNVLTDARRLELAKKAFVSACQEGKKKLLATRRNETPSIEIRVRTLQKDGIYPLDLPSHGQDLLAGLDTQIKAVQQPAAVVVVPRRDVAQGVRLPTPGVRWSHVRNQGRASVSTTVWFGTDNSYGVVSATYFLGKANAARAERGTFTFNPTSGQLMLSCRGTFERGKLKWVDEDEFVFTIEASTDRSTIGQRLVFTRAAR